MNVARYQSRLVGSGVMVASLAVLVLMVVGAGDALSTFFGQPIPGALEFAELMMVVVVFLALPDAEAHRKHIRIDLVSSRLPSVLLRPLGLLSAVISLAFYGAMAWQAWRLFGDSWAIREYTAGLVKFPVFPNKALFAVGLTAVTAVALRNVVRALGKPSAPPTPTP